MHEEAPLGLNVTTKDFDLTSLAGGQPNKYCGYRGDAINDYRHKRQANLFDGQEGPAQRRGSTSL